MAVPGEGHPYSKLTDDAVREIRATKRQTKALAAKYGVTKATIMAARRGATWGHVL